VALVPGFTDAPKNLEAIVEFIKEMGQSEIHLLAYHNMGETKIEIIQGAQKKLGLPSYPVAKLEKTARWFEQQGITARYNG